MTHEYTCLLGGHVATGAGVEATAIAWAHDTILAIGSDASVRGISRGDSAFVDLDGAWVVAVDANGDPVGMDASTLAVGGPADLAVVRLHAGGPMKVMAVVRHGHVIAGALSSIAGPDIDLR